MNLMNSKSDNPLRSDVADLRHLILGMRAAYARGDNAMEYARQAASTAGNLTIATLIAYDLQAGSYIAGARANPEGIHAGAFSWQKLSIRFSPNRVRFLKWAVVKQLRLQI